MNAPDDSTQRQKELAEQASQREPNVLVEFTAFLRQQKKWWLVPLLLSLVLVGVISVLSASPAGPFIYALF